jgi:hypothetical protein
LSSRVVTTSSTLKRVLRIAGRTAQRPPARKPQRIIKGTSDQVGRDSCVPMKTAAMAPSRNWPSAPMFQNLARKATATARPVSTRGAALTMVSTRLNLLSSALAKSTV